MSRSDLNNPSERMGRVLDDFDQLESAYMELAAKLAQAAPEVFQTCAPLPSARAVIEERARRQHTLARVKSARQRMRGERLREMAGDMSTQVTRDSYRPITEADLATLAHDLNPGRKTDT